MNEYTFLYRLHDPRDRTICYVGKADDPEIRLRQHLWAAKKGDVSPKAEWMRELMGLDLYPYWQIVMCVPKQLWRKLERNLIKSYRSAGYPLFNVQDGGDGVTWTKEMKDRAREVSTSLWQNSEYRDKTVKGIRVSKRDPNCKQLMADTQRERWADPDFRNAVVSGVKAAYEDLDLRARCSENTKKSWQEHPEWHEWYSVEHQARWKNEDFRNAVTKSVRLAYQDPNLITKLSALATERWEDPDYRHNCVQGLKGKSHNYHLSSESRQRRSDCIRNQWEDPEFKRERSRAIKEGWRRRRERLAKQEPIP